MLLGCRVAEHRSFASPADTLLTYQAALARDRTENEYACLSTHFQERSNGLTGYKLARDQVLSRNGWLQFFLSRNDLSDNIVHEDYSEDGREAALTVEIYGRSVEFRFLKEVLARLRFAGQPDKEAYVPYPASEAYAATGAHRVSLRTVEDLEPVDAQALRATEIEERWKIDSFQSMDAPEAKD